VDASARRVDVHRDVLLRVLTLEVQQLRDDEVCDLVVDRGAEEDDALVEQSRVDVELALSARRPLDDHRDQGHGRHPSVPRTAPPAGARLATMRAAPGRMSEFAAGAFARNSSLGDM